MKKEDTPTHEQIKAKVHEIVDNRMSGRKIFAKIEVNNQDWQQV